MQTLPLPVEARKQHKSFWSGFPKPKSHSQNNHHTQNAAQNPTPNQTSNQNQSLNLGQIQAHHHTNGFNGSEVEASPPSLLLAASDPPRTPSPLLPDTLQTINTEVSPLPSPLMGPRLELDPVDTPGTKTNSFFGSSWKSLIPTPAPPLPPPIRVDDLSNLPDSSTANANVSEPVDIPNSSASNHSRNHSDGHNKFFNNKHHANAPRDPTRSQTVDFFNTPHKYIPSPPPSIHHLSPDDKPEPAQRHGLARLSTGRVIEGARSPDDIQSAFSTHSGYHPSHSRSSSRSSASGFARQREFIYWTPESSDLSRSSSISSVSGIRRDFALTPARDDFTSSSPSNYPASPLALIRDEEEDTPVETSTPTPTQVEPERHISHTLVRRETRRNDNKSQLGAGMIIGDEAPLCLVRLLGKGAFSSVWLARDIEDRLIPPGPKQRRRKSVSTARRRDDPLPGIRPVPYAINHVPGGVLNELDGEGACLPRTPPSEIDNTLQPIDKLGKLVAVKLLERVLCDVNDRTRIAFVREVEVLRHISHPSIVAFLHSFTTASHHCLVLEHVGGGELFELMNSDENYAKLTTPLLRRMWGELCRAVGWLHGVSLVHRDIKLENILLTVNPFVSSDPVDLGTLPQPLVKLTDFGLARFIDPERPMLTTRCGSESYAAPEIVMGQTYDGRQTDAWACGIVLYALAMRTLPFDRKSEDHGRSSRRRYLVRIAKCEYTWPEDPVEGRLATNDLKKVVERLLVRDPTKRARIVDLWDEEFMRSEGAPSPPWRIVARRNKTNKNQGRDVSQDPSQTSTMENVPEEDEMEVEGEDEYEDAMLVDAHDISSIASQELL